MNDDEIIALFEREYQTYHGISAERVRQQQRAIREVAAACEKPILDIDADDFASWLAGLSERGLHVNTVRKKGNMVRPFFTWAFSKRLIPGERLMAVREVRNPKGATGHGLPKPYYRQQVEEFRQALAATYPKLEDFKLGYWRTGRSSFKRIATHSMRLQIEAIVALALRCGLRRQEIYDLEINDMHPENAYVVVRNGKGGKPRDVPYPKKARTAVAAWLDFRDGLGIDHDHPWLSLAVNQPKDKEVWKRPASFARFKSLLRPIPGEWHLHRFRHTCATTWLRVGMPLEKVSRLLGHASIQQTLGYAEIVKSDIHESMEKHQDAFDLLIEGASDKMKEAA